MVCAAGVAPRPGRGSGREHWVPAVDLDLVLQGASPDVLFEIPAPLEDAVLTASIDRDREQAECVESDNTWTVVVPGC